MPDNRYSIQPLPVQVAAQIQSSAALPSLASVVLGLISNSLDADACKIDVSVDFRRGVTTVEDDGKGIPPKEFAADGGLGRSHHTSKYNSTSATHGRSGTFLASAAALSILTIISHHYEHIQHASLILHHSKPVARLVPAPPHHHLSNREHGTRVTVQNLFGNMPVRVKQRALESTSGGDEKQFEMLKRQIVGLLLAWHVPVSVYLKSTENNKEMRIFSRKDSKPCEGGIEHPPRTLDISLVCSVLSQAGYIEPSDWDRWIKTSARTPFITIRGAISLQPAPSKQVQYISLGLRPINMETHSNVLYEEVNRLFASSSFGNQDELSDDDEASKVKKSKDRRFKRDGFTNKQLKGVGKVVDRWPMYYIRIEMQSTTAARPDDVEKLGERTMSGLLKVLGAMITGFLNEYHFRPRARPGVGRKTISKFPEVVGKSPVSASSGANTDRSHTCKDWVQDDTFSTWGRIKSGIKVKSSAVTPPPSSPLGHAVEVKSSISGIASPQSESNADLKRTEFTMTEDSEAVTNHGEQMIEWKNPVSGATVLVNARTGLVFNPLSSKRPANAPSNLGSFDSSSLTVASTNRSLGTRIRLMRCVSSSSPICPKAGSWCSELLKGWENPVFGVSEEAIPQVSLEGPSLETSDILHGRRHCCTDTDISTAFAQSSSSFSAKLSRNDLKEAIVIAQVDQKFILICMRDDSSMAEMNGQRMQLLVLVDQHAADERVRVEQLLAGLISSPTPLANPIMFEIPAREHALFTRHSAHFAGWGIVYDVSSPGNTSNCRLTVKALPAVVAERCRIEPKALIELLRGEAWKRDEFGWKLKAMDDEVGSRPCSAIKDPGGWLSRLGSCPQGLLEMLNSRACRSAIMFNDELTKAECQTLMSRLGDCAFPFQCAHGRPSMVPLLDIGLGIGAASGDDAFGARCGNEEGLGKSFGEAWKDWSPNVERTDETSASLPKRVRST